MPVLQQLALQPELAAWPLVQSLTQQLELPAVWVGRGAAHSGVVYIASQMQKGLPNLVSLFFMVVTVREETTTPSPFTGLRF